MTDLKTTDNDPLNDRAFDQLFRGARTFNAWQDRAIPEAVLQAVYDLAKWGSTSANCQPARFIFITSDEARARLKPHLAEGNVAKTMTAPCTVIIGTDFEFYRNLPEQFPHADATAWFVGNEALIDETARRNGTLQAAYLMLAARSLGLDCGPMSGFDQTGVNQEFFSDKVKANFLCNLGHGTSEDLFPRSPRLSFDQACEIV